MKQDESPAAVKLRHIRKSASRRGYSCSLTIGNVKKLIAETKCAYTGEEFNDTNTMSFDRVDNTKGYEPGNVIPVTIHANQLKSNFTVAEMRQLAKATSSRYDSFAGDVKKRIKRKEEKIHLRREQIADATRLLEKELAELKSLELEHARALKNVAESQRDGDIYMDIVKLLESNDNLGYKYLTFWQKVKKKLAFLIKPKAALTVVSQNSTETH